MDARDLCAAFSDGIALLLSTRQHVFGTTVPSKQDRLLGKVADLPPQILFRVIRGGPSSRQRRRLGRPDSTRAPFESAVLPDALRRKQRQSHDGLRQTKNIEPTACPKLGGDREILHRKLEARTHAAPPSYNRCSGRTADCATANALTRGDKLLPSTERYSTGARARAHHDRRTKALMMPPTALSATTI